MIEFDLLTSNLWPCSASNYPFSWRVFFARRLSHLGLFTMHIHPRIHIGNDHCGLGFDKLRVPARLVKNEAIKCTSITKAIDCMS